ncbi:MAG: ActS/PrrB/RegB family redox-sensitive histidine kinase [Rhodoblastus sp.]|nr:MAG: ActS/PrrB/RegB family redox-sensitive histidine kinase [Rhodoblastus sp.]
MRVDTLTRLRWLAVAGQLAATLVARFALSFDFAWIACLALIGASAALNLALRRAMPLSRRLSAATATALLAYDLAQLAGLLFLTGGLQNPFSLLFIAPVAVSAATLPPRHSVGLFLFMATLAAAISVWRMPLPWFESAPEPEWRGLRLAVGWLALVIGAGFIGVYSGRVAHEARQLSDALAAADLALERQSHLSQLDGVAAAAAHELGTPLGTIRLVTREWLNGETPQADDVKLVSDEADRCRAILKKLSSLRSDPMLQQLALGQLIEEAVAPHRGVDVAIAVDVTGEGPEPTLRRNPALDYGLGNLVENAMDFAQTRVRVEGRWTRDSVTIVVADDGPGFPSDVLRQIGDPYLRSAREGRRVKDEGGLGLGLFIAKTLLERTGAALAFANERSGGAVARMRWRRADLEPDAENAGGENSTN